MKKYTFVLIILILNYGFLQAQKILFDNTKSEEAGNADWVIDHTEPTPYPAQSGISASTSETYWDGAISAWGVEMVKRGFTVETLPSYSSITYGSSSNSQDLSGYDVFVVCEPNNLFSASEKTAIMNFVKNGGGLFMVADHANSDRDGDGYDSYDAWRDLISNNSVQNYAFGMIFDDPNYINDYPNYNTANLPGDPLLHGPAGDVNGMEFHGAAAMSINTSDNSTVKGVVFRTGYSTTGTTGVMVAYSQYGQGKVVGMVDSSPADDGTGNPGDNLYYGWNEIDNGILITNATLWLADKSNGIIQNPDNNISVFPNPAGDNIEIDFNKKIKTVELYSLSGKLLKSKNINEKRILLDISGLDNGLYFVRIFTDTETFTRKITVNR